MNDANAGRLSVACPLKMNSLARDVQLPIVVPDDSRENLHERALACSILTANGMQFASHNIERDV